MGFEGRVVRVMYPKVFPAVDYVNCRDYPNLRVTKSCPFPGLMVEILHLLTQNLNLTIIPMTVRETDWDLQHVPLIINDQPNGIPKLLYNGTIDLIAATFQVTPARKKYFSFSEPLYAVQTSMITHQRATITTSVWSFFRTYNLETWYVILTALLIQIALCILVRKVECNMCEAEEVGILESAWQMLRLQLMQPEKIYFKSLAGRLSIMIFSLIQCAVFLGIFSSWILSNFIMEAKEDVPFESMNHFIRDLEAKKFYMTTSHPDTWFFEQINSSKTFPFLQLREALKVNPLRKVSKPKIALKAVVKDLAVAYTQNDENIYYAANKYCKLVYIQEEMPVVNAHFLFRKNWSLAALFNQTIRNNMMYINRYHRKYKYLLKKDKPYCASKKLHTALGIYPYVGLLFICSVIVSVAVVALVMEIFGKNIDKKLKKYSEKHPGFVIAIKKISR